MPTWAATTASGTRYEFDTTTETVTRLDIQPEGDLRRDGDALSILSCTPPIVGAPLMMLLHLRGDGVLTLRETSIVTALSGDVPV